MFNLKNNKLPKVNFHIDKIYAFVELNKYKSIVNLGNSKEKVEEFLKIDIKKDALYICFSFKSEDVDTTTEILDYFNSTHKGEYKNENSRNFEFKEFSINNELLKGIFTLDVNDDCREYVIFSKKDIDKLNITVITQN